MSNTSTYFENINKYRSAVKAANEELDKKLREAEDAKGSIMFDKLVNKSTEERNEVIEKARKTVKSAIDESLKKMKANVNELKPIPPTSEMLEHLQLLKMRDNVTDEEIRAAGEMCSGCPAAWEVVHEMAQKRGLPLAAKQGTLGGENGLKAIEKLRKAAEMILSMQKVNNRDEWFKMSKSYTYSIEDTTNGKAFDYYMYDKDFNDDKSMIKDFSGIIDNFDSFYETINK